MPQLELSYSGLLAQAIDRRRERRHLPGGATLGDLLHDLEREHGERVHELLFDACGGLLPQALIAVDGTAVRDLATPLPDDGSVVRILVLSPMMIGG